MKLRDLVKSAPTLYKSGTAIHLIGPPGVGKSDVLKNEFRSAISEAVGEELGFWDTLLPTVDAPDIRGFLVPSKDKDGHPISFFTRSGVLPPRDYLEKHPRGVYVFDERNSSDLLTQKAIAPCTLWRRFGDEYLPPGWLIAAASNRTEDRAGVIRSPAHLVNRERTLPIEADIVSWSLWAEDKGIHPMLIAFAKNRPGVVMIDSVPKTDGPFCTPRSYVSAAHLLSDVAGLDDSGNPNMKIPVSGVVSQMVTGDIGESACSELFAFLKNADELPTIEEIEANPEKAKCPKDLSAAYAAAQMCIHYAKPALIDKLWRYAERLPKEIQVSTAKNLIEKGGGILLNSQALSKWIMSNKALINATNRT